ncbi:MAG: AI-2E family transporter [Oscillospiraceae bacterium]|nr:AI-2E family transporter [Oscillospiraceae bacterium]
MDKKSKNIMLIIAFSIVMYAAVMNLGVVLSFLGKLVSLVLPLVIGLVLAFVLSVPMNGFENLLRKLFSGTKNPVKEKFLTAASFLLTIATVLCIAVLAVTMLIPEIARSIMGVVEQAQLKLPQWLAVLNSYNIDTQQISEWLNSINAESLLSTLTGSAGFVLDSVLDISTTIVSAAINTGLGLVIMVYVLLSRKTLKHQCHRVLYAYLSREKADNIVHVASLIYQTYAKFFSGQCLESCILGSLIFIAFSIARLPYAGLIAVLTALCAFIPYVGSFISCCIGALLTLLSSPAQAMLCIVVYLAVQFIENQFIYPNVVGNSVGLPPLFTLLAVMLGGKLFGILGMIFFIPLMAVVYALVREDVQRRDVRKPIPRDSKFSP